MNNSTKAALLSGLVFPGAGHMFLKQYLRGSILIVLSLIATTVIVTIIFQRALAIIDRINSGEVAIEAGGIADMAYASANNSGGSAATTALVVLGICWLIGIFDSYRIGNAQEKSASGKDEE